MRLHKYPRTHHLEDSRLQPGDADLSATPLTALGGRSLVIEEKVDGANCAVSFTAGGGLQLQSRGHFLTGGPRERHFALLKAWASAVRGQLHAALGARYVMYGEWLYAKHTVFYDRLPHYFLEFDVLDTDTGAFLSTAGRRELLAGAPVFSVPVLHEGPVSDVGQLHALVGPSRFKSADWRSNLRKAAVRSGCDPDRVTAETDVSDRMEGLYVKVEEGGVVTDRYKWVRVDFLTSVLDSGSHWLDRPIVANGLVAADSVFGGARL